MLLKRLRASLGLKWRLILGVSALLLTSSLLLSIFLIGEFSDTAIDGLQQRGSSLARNLAYNAEFGVMLENTSELNALISGVLIEHDILFVQIDAVDGKLLAEGKVVLACVGPGMKPKRLPEEFIQVINE